MVNWQDPSLLFNDYIALIKLNHALAGIFIWEIVTTLSFEWDVLRGKRPYRWTIWVSSFKLWHITTTSTKVAISRNPLHRLTYFYYLLYRYRWPQGSLFSIHGHKFCVALCQLGIRFFNYRPPRNRDMESQYRRVATCFRRMGGWSCF